MASPPTHPPKQRNPLIDVFGARVRRIIYTVYALAGVVLGAIQVGFAANDAATPAWLKTALAVLAFLGTAIGATAASNARDTTS
jgi:hypothetical protein